MNETADLSRSLAFVFERIEREAARSGVPLSDEERFLLNNLPREPVVPVMNGTDPDSPPLMPAPRDVAYERLIALVRDARRNDLRVNPSSDVEWKIAFVISKITRHPMSWVLAWAGMKERTPWWDRAGLVAGALLFTGGILALVIFAEAGGGTPLRWIAAGAAYIVMLLFLWRASRRIEVWQLRRSLEKYHGAAGSGNNEAGC
jgi:hypothetical protein